MVVCPVRHGERNGLGTVVAQGRRNPGLVVHLDEELPPVPLDEVGFGRTGNDFDSGFRIDVDADQTVRIERSLNHPDRFRAILFFFGFTNLLFGLVRERRTQIVKGPAQPIDLNKEGLRILAGDYGQFGGG